MANSAIGWTEKVWNPVTGCNKVSAGCKFCYAEIMHRRLSKMQPEKYGRPFLDGAIDYPPDLNKPMEWKKPSMIFVNSMSDLFHVDIPFYYVFECFVVMMKANHHTYQILTKRHDRMLEFFNFVEEMAPEMYEDICQADHIWLGVSVENQQMANIRIPALLKTPIRTKILSCEPLLGPLEIVKHCVSGRGDFSDAGEVSTVSSAIAWVIAGGESGHQARAPHPDWFRSLRDQCASMAVPFFFKQWGSYYTQSFKMTSGEPSFRMFESFQQWVNKAQTWVGSNSACVSIDGLQCMNGADMKKATYPVAIMDRMSKKNAGNLLDGKLHEAYPHRKSLEMSMKKVTTK